MASTVFTVQSTADKILAMVTKTGTDLKGFRDRAILLLGFAGAFRRSELVALNVEDLEFCDDGIRVTIRKNKTDQEGMGSIIAIAQGSIACLPMLCGFGKMQHSLLMVPYSALLRKREKFLRTDYPPEESRSS